jgi:hypothetical protein
MRRVAINNYKQSSLVYSNCPEDVITFFKDHLEKIEDDNGNFYFTFSTPLKCIPHWKDIDPSNRDAEIALLGDIVKELIPMAELSVGSPNKFHVCIPTDVWIDEMIGKLTIEIFDKKAELKKWKKLKIK